MKSIRILLPALVFLLTAGASCEKNNGNCPEDLMCTMVFKSIQINITDPAGNPITLTSAKISSQHLQAPINPLDHSVLPGVYELVNDGHMQFLSNREAREFLFEGWIGDEKVVHEVYQIKHDCCHVVLESGNKEVVIQNPSE